MGPNTITQAPLPIRLPQLADALQLEELRKSLMARLNGDGPVMLSGAAVEQIGTSTIQTLLAFDRSLTRDRRRLMLQDPSPALKAGFTDLGLSDVMRNWMADLG
jgi:anti-anti-sigma regulatory factor